jgi:hypothetical protein
VTEDHSLLRSNGEIIKPMECIVGTELLHKFPDAVNSIVNYKTNNQITDFNDAEKTFCYNKLDEMSKLMFDNVFRFNKNEFIFRAENQIDAMNIFYCAKMFGLNVYVNNELTGEFTLECTTYSIDLQHKIKQIKCLGQLNTDDFVYDLETETGNFHAGVGQLIVKNTDSVFVVPNFKSKSEQSDNNEIMTNKIALEKAIKLGELISEMTFMIMREPMELEYEKTYWPLCLLKKKKYVGNLYQTNTTSYYQNNMGIVLKRRDNAPIVKMVCGGIVKELLNNTSEGAINYTKKILRDIIDGNIPIDKYIITKTLKGTYKDRSKMAHAVLADRLEQRTGNKIASNTRIAFAYIANELCNFVVKKNNKIQKKTDLLQGDMIEDPDYIVKNNLKIDSLFYITNQIMKPSCQFLELVINEPEKLFFYFVNKEINKRKGKKNIAHIYE